MKFHESLNSSKGIVYAPCLINITESEIVSEMSSQGVIDVYKFSKQIEGKRRPSGLMLFTFDLYQPPNSVEIGWYKSKVNEYIPNPMRCRNCQLLGHTKNRCNREEACETCSLPPHSPEECTRVRCANCSEPHPSSSINCPKYKQSKEILTIKTRNKCSMSEAKRTYNIQNPLQSKLNSTPYAERAKEATRKNNTSSDNATSLEKSTPSQQSIAKKSDPTSNKKSSNIANSSSALITISPNNSSLPPPKHNQHPDNQPPSCSKQTHLTQRPLPTPPRIISTNTINQSSPITSITNSLINDNNYFMNTSDTDDNI